MDDRGQHDPIACSRAWQTLRLAHDRVARRLETDLAHECGLALNEFDVLLYLRTHPEDARAYGDLKLTLASEFLDDRAGYQAAKAPYVARLVAALRRG